MFRLSRTQDTMKLCQMISSAGNSIGLELFQFEAIFPMNINSIFLCIKFSAPNCQSHHFWTTNKTQQSTVRQSCAILRASNPFEGQVVHVEKRLQRVTFKQFHLLTNL